tara:strand:+ start:2418 stop:3377 length:960 start_codon:yes stop_codon:yes gene_type:complete
MKKINNYPLIFKKLVCEYYFEHKGKQTISDILKIFKISNGSLYNWVNQYNQKMLTNKCKYKKMSKYTPAIKCFIRAYVIKHIDFDYKKLIINIKNKYKLTISITSLYDIIKQMNITRKQFKQRIVTNKKKQTMEIRKFKKQINAISNDDIISIDETSVDTHISSGYGWSLKGTNIIKTNKKSRIRYTVISAISNKQIIYNKIIKGSSNAIHFKEFLMTVLSNFQTNKYLLMDNARIHHSKIVLDYIQTTDHKIIYNVPYCPEYNPIEMMFSKFKSLMRKKDNSLPLKLFKNISKSANEITEHDLLNFYKHSFDFKIKGI